MRRAVGVLVLAGLAGVALASAAIAAPLAVPTSVATKLQLHGHLPDLGEVPAMWVFNDASSYDSFRLKLDITDVLPDSGSLYMTFDKELLALYTRGADSGGRCLRAGSVSGVVATTVALDLSWDPSSCGAPASAHYPFVLVSLSRLADDGATWMSGRDVCAAAPGVDGSRACAPATGVVASAAPSASVSRTPAASPTPTDTPAATPAPTTTPPPPRTPIAATPTLAPSTVPTATGSAVVAGSSNQGGGILDIAGWVAVGLIVGVFVTALVMRPRVYRV